MGIKRRAMYNPKFRKIRPKRWELGRKKLGIPIEEEIEAERLAEEASLKAEEEAKVKLETANEAKRKAAEEAKVKLARATEAKNKAEETPKVKLSREATKSKPKTKAKPKTKTTRSRKPRAKKE